MNGQKSLQIITSCSPYLVVPLSFIPSHFDYHGLLRVKVNSPRNSSWPLIMSLNLFWPRVLLNLQCQSLIKLYPLSLWDRKKTSSSLGLSFTLRPLINLLPTISLRWKRWNPLLNWWVSAVTCLQWTYAMRTIPYLLPLSSENTLGLFGGSRCPSSLHCLWAFPAAPEFLLRYLSQFLLPLDVYLDIHVWAT